MWEKTLFWILSELHSYIGHDGKYPHKRNFDHSVSRILSIWNFDNENYYDQTDEIKESVDTEISYAKRVSENNH